MINPFKTIQNWCSTILTVLFLGWFGISSFKLGFYASETPMLSSVVRFLLDEQNSDESKTDSLLTKTIQRLGFEIHEDKRSKDRD
jgi:hypothetical protein